MKTNRFVAKVANSLGVTERHMTQRVYPLLEALDELNERTGRADGEINPAVAASILLCMVGPTSGLAPAVTLRAQQLKLVPHPDHDLATLGLPDLGPEGCSLHLALALAIQTGCIEGRALEQLQEISIAPDGENAFMLMRAPAGFIRLIFATDAARGALESGPTAEERRRAQNAFGGNQPQARLTLGRGFLSQCHLWIYRETTSWWEGDGSKEDLAHRRFVASEKTVRELKALVDSGGAGG